VAGRTLFSLGLVKGSEGNLSTWDGARLLITRTGSRLAELGADDVLEGTLDAPPERASSDLEIHVATYRERGPGAVAHDHAPGSVPDGWVEGSPHGRYGFAATLSDAVEDLVRRARESS
jgi:L-fuculose-phosphate aldolase